MGQKKNSYIGNNLKENIDRGSITVEAAFVLPIVILTVFALIYLTFYLHDICRIQALTDMTLHKAGITVKHEADIATGEVAYDSINDRGVFYILFGNSEKEEEQIQSYLMQQLKDGLFLTRISGVSVKADKFKIKISVKTVTEVSLPGIRWLFEPFSNTIVAGEYSVHNPAEAIRCTEVILETGSSIKGVDKIKEKLEAFFGSK